MRYWDRAKDPDRGESRSRSTVHSVSSPAPSQFGQRPMFSVPGENQPPPAQATMGTEARLDPVVPTDESEGSKSRTVLETTDPRTGILLPYSTDNVSATPTEAELNAAFGAKPVGWAGFVIDGGAAGVVWFCIKSKSDLWWFERLTKAT